MFYRALEVVKRRHKEGEDMHMPGEVEHADERTPRRTRTPSRDVHAALVEAAEAVLVREGPAAVTVRAVASEAGVAPMGVYNRFGSKDGLMEMLLIRGFAGLRDAVQAPGVSDPIERLRRSGELYREFALSHPQHYAIMFEGAIQAAEFSPELAEVAASTFGALVSHVTAAMAAGAFTRGDPVEAAQLIWSSVHGAVTLELHGVCQVTDPEANYRLLQDLVLRALSAQ
jgi:AcrR family transcriptional regulator